MRPFLMLLAGLTLAACPPPPEAEDTGIPDTDTDTDDTDTGDTDDTDTDTGDTDTGDTDAPTDGTAIYQDGPWDCDTLSSGDLTGRSPNLRSLAVTLDGAPDRATLSDGGRTLLDAGTLGGSSIQSEILAFEVLHRCEDATLELTEGEVPYIDAGGKKTDMVVTLDGARLGVSVARAVGFPPEDPYPESRARDLLDDKLSDILLSSANVEPGAAWAKQVLVVPAWAPEHLDSLEAAWDTLPADTRADTVVLVVVTNGTDRFIYFND